MKILHVLNFCAFFIPGLLFADTYPEVIFDNSLVKGVYAKSSVHYNGGSWVENVNRHLLVSDTLFFTPGNALSLKYQSATTGDWTAEVSYSRQKYHYNFDKADFLSFRIFVKTTGTEIADLPKLYIKQRAGNSVAITLDQYIDDYEDNKWVHVKIPLQAIDGLNFEQPISAVGFQQNRQSQTIHHLFLDQVEFLEKNYSQVKLSSPAILTEAVPYDRQVHLKWQLPLTPSIHYIKIYRSEDGENFSAVGIRPVQMQSSFDIVPVMGRKYYYKITWVDFNYKESPFSAVREITNTPLSQDKLLDLIQLAHVNYFVENYDINSGMYMPFRQKNKAVVSTKETAGAVLALLVGTERKFVTRQAALGRISKIVYFLLKAQNNHGIFPAYFNGRTGIPEHRSRMAHYDVLATSSIVEALLLARTYFSADAVEEVDLRKRITKLYENVNWQYITLAGTNDILPRLIPAVNNDMQEAPEALFGINESLNTYLLAMAAPKFALPKSSYYKAIYQDHSPVPNAPEPTVDVDVYADTVATDSLLAGQVNALQPVPDTLARPSILKDTLMFGIPLRLGEYNRSLMELYKPFLTIEPDLLKDTILDFPEVLKSYVHFVKRRDNEMGVGSTNSDIWGFYQHRDSVGNYRINPAIAPSAIFVDNETGQQAILALYGQYANVLFTEYGFRAWLDLRNDDVSDEYLALNQSTLLVALENARTGLLWNLYKEIPELKSLRDSFFTKNIVQATE